jgi:hypothetical protein
VVYGVVVTKNGIIDYKVAMISQPWSSTRLRATPQRDGLELELGKRAKPQRAAFG